MGGGKGGDVTRLLIAIAIASVIYAALGTYIFKKLNWGAPGIIGLLVLAFLIGMLVADIFLPKDK